MDNAVFQNFAYFRSRISPDREAVYDWDSGVRYTHGEMMRRGSRLARYMVEVCGMKKGDCVGLFSPNHVAFLDAFLAGLQTGIIVAAYNFKMRVEELCCTLREERPRLMIYDAAYAGKVAELRAACGIEHCLELCAEPGQNRDPRYEDLQAQAAPEPLATPIDPEDIQIYMHTGGTTGTPKTAMISYRAMFYNIVSDVFTNSLYAEDTAYVFLPFFHTSAWNIITLPLLMCGGRIILKREFDPADTLRIISEERPTVGMAVPTVYKRLAEHPLFEQTDFSCFKWLSSGGSTVQKSVMERYWARGIRLANGYGMTEAGPHNLTLPLHGVSIDSIRRKWNSVGVPMYFNQIRIVDDAGRDVPCGTLGELLFSGPMIFSGYLGQPEQTKRTLQDGWIHTGDIAWMDGDGYYYIVGRKKNMYISGGENIYPSEIEAVIAGYPGVLDVCVIGVADEEWGEVGLAVLVIDERQYQAGEFQQYLHENLSSIKVPRYLRFTPEIPTNAAGKKSIKEIRRLFGQIQGPQYAHPSGDKLDS